MLAQETPALSTGPAIAPANAPGNSQTNAKPLTNDDIMALVAAEMPDDIVMAKIHAARQTSFDTSVAGLKTLRQAGVSSRVIRYMIDPSVYPRAAALPPPVRGTPLTLRAPGTFNQSLPVDDPDNPLEPHAPGVYLRAKGSDGIVHMTRLDHITAKNTKTTGAWLSGITYGAAQAHTKASIDGAHANVQTEILDPVFYVYTPSSTRTSVPSMTSA